MFEYYYRSKTTSKCAEEKNVNYGFERTFFIFYEVKIAGRLRVQHVGKFEI